MVPLEGGSLIPCRNQWILRWKLTTSSHLGLTTEDNPFVVSTYFNILENKASVVLHDGPTTQHLISATTRHDNLTGPNVLFLFVYQLKCLMKDRVKIQMGKGSSGHTSPTFTLKISGNGL